MWVSVLLLTHCIPTLTKEMGCWPGRTPAYPGEPGNPSRIEVKSAVGEEAAQKAGLKQDFLEGSTPSQSSGMTKYQEGGEKRERDTVSQE